MFFLQRIGTRNCFLLVLIPMFAVAIILRIVFAFIPMPRPDMTLDADGLIETKTIAEAQTHTTMPIGLPDDLLGSEVYSVGVYTQGAGTLPIGSVTITLVKNNQRFVEIVERPGTTLADVVNDYSAIDTQEVSLNTTSATLISLQTRDLRCVSPNEKWHLPGFCEIPRILLFERNGTVTSIAADNTHATDGELISLAKSLLP